MSEWVDKVWGKTKEVNANAQYAKHILRLLKHTYCSLHYHKHKANKFTVLSGSVEIIEMYGPSIVKTTLVLNEPYIVPSLVPHMFVVHEGGDMVEEYFPDRGGVVDSDDIVRITKYGGIVNAETISHLPLNIIDCFRVTV